MAERDRLTLSKGVRLSCIAARKDLHACSLLMMGETQLPRTTALVHSLYHSNNVESWQTVRSAGAPILLKGSHAGRAFDVWMQGETCMLDSGGAVPRECECIAVLISAARCDERMCLQILTRCNVPPCREAVPGYTLQFMEA
jgi:hypothetical protein